MVPNEKNIYSLQNKLWYIIRSEENLSNTNSNNYIINENEQVLFL